MAKIVTAKHFSEQREQAIQKLAYSIWENDGYPNGRDSEHWVRAEQIIDAENKVIVLQGTGSRSKETQTAVAAKKRNTNRR